MSDDVVIRFDGVTKYYVLDHLWAFGVKNVILHLPTYLRERRERARFCALSDVSFEVRKGECFGVIGRNGSGKSTTLGLVAGVLRPTAGAVETRGHICPLLELGAGFHHELTGRDNILLNGVLLGMTAEGLLGPFIVGISRSLPGWAFGSFMSQGFIPIINGSNQAIWQSKVPPGIQGRVFATRRMIAQFSFPIAVLFAGPLADRVFEPAMRAGEAAAATFGPLVGTGPGAGMALMVAASGLIGAAIGLAGYLIPAIRNVEDILPDFDAVAPAPVVAEVAIDPQAVA